MFATFSRKILQAHCACQVIRQTKTNDPFVIRNRTSQGFRSVCWARCSSICTVIQNKNLAFDCMPQSMAQALRHRHRRDVYNTFFSAAFTFNRQVLDLRSWQQPQYCMLTAHGTKKTPLVCLVFFNLLFIVLQLFSPQFPRTPPSKQRNKKARTTIAYSDTWHRL